ncbi:MAG: hypothetical protein QXD29_00815 [Thermoplasmata archaeon]
MKIGGVRAYRLMLRPRRLFIFGIAGLVVIARRAGAIEVKGYCKKHKATFNISPRNVESVLMVKCPVGGEKLLRSIAVLNYIVGGKYG